ncbi:MAG TPA: protein-L-isoaspartate carboxylmethyltransferase [Dermatophilaceae bacterium]|jgi:protein-L-isoaspartate(D-aspartate) O-methyltransferase|nr:protein-L-isoaspartate carboxylmethyltransferase [Dermatophilaceae bacterium]HMT88577.1 protein-L-isoaspartate carboxylmethyltransferase [Dermatophilaceae bacterium]
MTRLDLAWAACPRATFLPRAQRRAASRDTPVPIGHGQTNSQPSTVRRMLEELDVQVGHRVLDVGSGSGWTTALLAHLVGPDGWVLGVERVPALVASGAAVLADLGMPWATIRPAAPGVLGAPELAPYDRILVSAMASKIPADLLAQLGPAGIMVIPADGALWRVTPNGAPTRLGSYRFVPLVLD